jgi:homoserine kinase
LPTFSAREIVTDDDPIPGDNERRLMLKSHVTAFAPASVSNVACGFDIMGFALSGLGDRVTIRHDARPGLRIAARDGNPPSLPADPELNTAGPPVREVAKWYGHRGGLVVEINKGLPIGSGIGSSAASAVAAAVAANALLGGRMSKTELLACAIEGEKIASGSVHADNLAPALWGGFTLIRGYDPPDVIPLRCPRPLWCALILPDVEIRTKESRGLLPASLPLSDVIAQTGNAAGLVAGLVNGDYGLIGRSLQDRIAEPVRRHLIPAYGEMKAAALVAGALGCNISGSGPAVFALCADEVIATRVVRAMSLALEAAQCRHQTMISRVDGTGAHILE